ncbi:MAG: FAD-dependent oxidoreductase [Amylibacter sp.]|nr:FAD-dependent oxidoreductase [Amylibacter sp.]
MNTDVIIVGGGLSGLALADHLHRAGVDYLVLEARTRLGGRVHVGRIGDAAFDLGPSWFWPGQPRMAALVERFGLTVFDQYSDGRLSFEDEQGDVHRGMGYASMEGSYRIQGGIIALTDALAAGLDPQKIKTDAGVTTLRDGVEVVLQNGDIIKGKQVIMALPPRVAAGLAYEPVLPAGALDAMRTRPTWMGGQAKFVAVYDRPFWREKGLSGDAMSRRGPLGEIHDATDPKTGLGALFGFVGVPAAGRMGQGEVVKSAAVAQLGRIFGAQALTPKQVFYHDWAQAVETASDLDAQPMNGHPFYGLPDVLSGLWESRLRMGSTEVAAQFGGFLEGALEIAENLAQDLIADR